MSLFLVSVSLLVSCGGEADDRPTVVVAPTALTVHEVLREERPPCSGLVAQGDERVVANDTDCLLIGPPLLDGADVAEAWLAEPDPDGNRAVDVELSRQGAVAFDAAAARNLGRRLALLVDGRLVSAPVVHAPEYHGRLQVSGLTQGEAVDLVRRLGGEAAPSGPPTDVEGDRAPRG